MEFRGQFYTFDSQGRLGAGGMAEVYLATVRDQPDLKAAIKIPLPDLDEAVRNLFLREAEAAQQVDSPHVVKVIDWGEVPPFIAFEYVEGISLGQELRTREGSNGYWSLPDLIGLYRQLVAGMSAINQHVIHRDLKPENIFVQGDQLKVSDFGIAKYADEVTRTRTFKGWGTPQYMAPEAFRFESLDWRSDQYSLGIVFYEMATLQRLFVGTPDELEAKHLYERPPRVTSVVPALPERLATLIARMLEKQLDKRYPTWGEIDGELSNLKDTVASADSPVRVDDDLARIAANRLEETRAQALAQQREKDDRGRKVREREGLLDYWAGELLGELEGRVKSINASLGEEAVLFRRRDEQRVGLATRAADARFLNSGLGVTLQVIPVDASDEFLLWGFLELRTNRRIWLGNFLLQVEPPPYGSWLEIDLRVMATMRGGFEPQDEKGGRYEVAGDGRIVVALNWEGLLQQREERNVTSGVTYAEKSLDYAAILDEVLKTLVEDANIEPPPKRRSDGWQGPPMIRV